MTPWIDDRDFQLYVGDVRDVLANLESGSVDCVITSPPYWGLRDYGTGEWAGGDPDHQHDTRGARNGRGGSGGPGKQTVDAFPSELAVDQCSCGATRLDQQLGLEPTPEAYVAQMVEVFRGVRRVLADHGTVWLNLGDSYIAGQGGRQSSVGELPPVHRSDRIDPGPRPDLPNPPAGWAERQMTTRTYPARETGLKPKDLAGMPWRVAQALQAPYYTGRIKDERDRIWLAATVEAEGCLFLHKRGVGQYASSFTKKDGTESHYHRKNATYGAGLEVASTDRVIVERCMAITGIGSICEQSPEQNARRKQTIYRWNVRSNECRWIIHELYPHLLAKKHEARLLLGCPSSGDDARKAHESLKAIHQGQTACIDFGEPEGMWERGWFLRSEIIWAKLCRIPCLNP